MGKTQKTMNIELQQKWQDFINPTSLVHYGYQFTEPEMRQFPEGRAVLCGFKREVHYRKRLKKEFSQTTSLLNSFAEQYHKAMEKIDLNPNELSIDRLEQVTVKLNEIVDWINEQEAIRPDIKDIRPIGKQIGR